MVKITFLGTSHSVPEKNRKCSSILLEVENKKYIIDAGMDILSKLTDMDIYPDSISAVFISHAHGDHLNGLISYVEICNWYYKTANFKIFVPTLDIKKVMIDWFKLRNDGLIRDGIEFIEEKEGLIFSDNLIKVYCRKTGHIDPTYSYIVESCGKTLFFSSDMKGEDGAFSDYERITHDLKLDFCVCEGIHFNPLLYKTPLLNNPPKIFCINHYSSNMIDCCMNLKKELQNIVDVNIVKDDDYFII